MTFFTSFMFLSLSILISKFIVDGVFAKQGRQKIFLI